jgi:hypothetical protein
MSFLNDKRWGSLTNRWNLVLKERSEDTCSLTNHWILVLVGVLEGTRALGRILRETTPNTFLGAAP